MLEALPLFPLNLVLYPGGRLPLRIFELRYLDMITRCRRDDAPFGVVALTAGREVHRPGAAESFAAVGTLARLTQCHAPQPGLMLIESLATQRFRIQGTEQRGNGLWVARADALPEDLPVELPDDLQHLSDALTQVLHQLQDDGRADASAPTRAQLQDCGWVAHRWCELLPLPLQQKQRLLELDSPLMRLELVGDLLEQNGWLKAGPRTAG